MAKATLDRARLAIADKIDEWTLDTALWRHRRGQDIGPQLDILTENHQRRQAILADGTGPRASRV